MVVPWWSFRGDGASLLLDAIVSVVLLGDLSSATASRVAKELLELKSMNASDGL